MCLYSNRLDTYGGIATTKGGRPLRAKGTQVMRKWIHKHPQMGVWIMGGVVGSVTKLYQLFHALHAATGIGPGGRKFS